MDYKEQIKHPNWQKKRLEILKRDDFMCQECNDTKNQLHVHHLTYTKNSLIWEYDNSNLITYCSVCHDNWHKIKNEIVGIISQPNLFFMLNILDFLELIGKIGNDNLYEVINIVKSIKKIKT